MCIHKKSYWLLFLTAILCCLSACGEKDTTGQDTGRQKEEKEDRHITFVKEGSPLAYPDQTYGEAFETFFVGPTWEYFEGSTEDSDEVSDVVEFTGYCTYEGVKVLALVQFTLDMDDRTFEATYLSFNDVPQTELMLLALIDAAFTNEDLDTAVNTASEPDTPTVAPAPYLGDYVMHLGID